MIGPALSFYPMVSELRYVVRSLIRRKGFALVTLLTLALGIGSATAIYSVVDWWLFQPPSTPPGVYLLGSLPKEGSFVPIMFVPHYEAYGKLEIFSEVAASCFRQGNVVVDHDPVETTFIDTSTGFFSLLGVAPAMGRGFLKGEDVEGRNDVVVVSHGFWRDKLGGRPDVLGSKITVDRQECTVVGVLREGQRMPGYSDSSVYRPLVVHYDPAKPWDPNLMAYALARPGATRTQIEQALSRAAVTMPPELAWARDWKPAVRTVEEMQRFIRPDFYGMLLGAVGFLYGIACLNATNLMLVHLLGKQREISVRMALGGGRWRVIRLLVIEALGLSLCGSALGALVANVLIPLFNRASSGSGKDLDWGAWHLSWRTFIVLGGLTLVTGLLISVVPALHALRSNIQTGLKNGGGAIGESPRLARLRGTFVVLQSTFAVILLVGAGLMVQSFSRLEDVKVGFDPSHRIKVQLAFPSGLAEKKDDRLALLHRLQDRLEQVPGVKTVAFSSSSLMAQYDAITMDVSGKDGATAMHIHPVYVSSNYQQAAGLVLKGGRWISDESKNEVLVNETLARTRFATTDVVGQYLKPAGTTGSYKGWHVVGVVGDVREQVREDGKAKVYMPISWSPTMASDFILEMQSDRSAEAQVTLRQAVFQLDPRIVTHSVRPLVALRDDQLYNEHLALSVLRLLAGIAVLLTTVGTFSVLAYTVDRRMAEFGIRMALGASPANVVALVVRRGLVLTVLGILAGIAGALALARFMRSLLYETASYDPVVLGAVAALLVIAAMGACILPAVRASKPDLVSLLKSD